MDLEHERRLTEVEARTKSNQHRLEEVEKRQDNLDELVGTVKTLAVREERMESDVQEIKSDVKTLTGKAGQRWETVANDIIKLIVAAVIGFFLAQIGL